MDLKTKKGISFLYIVWIAEIYTLVPYQSPCKTAPQPVKKHWTSNYPESDASSETRIYSLESERCVLRIPIGKVQ